MNKENGIFKITPLTYWNIIHEKIEISSFMVAWMNMEDIMPSKISQVQKD
jgi:hypothetical protein